MAASRIRVGVLGLTHDHIWSNLDHLAKLDGAELVGAAEPDAALRERFSSRYGDKLTVADYDGLLEGDHDLQALFIFADNRASAELAARAARRGLHVMLEKPMAADLAQADRLLAAARRGGAQADDQLAAQLEPQGPRGPPAGPGRARSARSSSSATPAGTPGRARSAVRPSSATGSTTPSATASGR